MGSIDLSWSVQKDRDSFIDLYGERGTIKVGWKGSWYKTVGTKDWTPFGSGYDKVASFVENLGNFARHLRDGETLRIKAEDALANVAAINAGYKSLRKQQWAPTLTDTAFIKSER
ncbi:MAG: hypothetical protein U0798_04065 [Gemmataceae bacterium]